MKEKTIVKRLKDKTLSLEDALVGLAKTGACPCLLNDDNGHWAVTFNGFQSLPSGRNPEDIQTSFWIEKKYWHKNIIKALIYALEN